MPSRSHDSFVADQFSPSADAYVVSAVHARGEDLEALSGLVGLRPEARAVDLGSGGGHLAFALAPLTRSVVAYDLSAAMLEAVAAEAGRRGLANVETRQGSVEALPWPDGAFDIVASRYSAHHWRDVGAGLREARRVLKPGGLAVFADVVAPEDPLLDTWLHGFELLRDPSHVRNYSLDAMADDGGGRRLQADALRALSHPARILRLGRADEHAADFRRGDSRLAGQGRRGRHSPFRHRSRRQLLDSTRC